MATVLVTGGSGFVGSHCILQLLAEGHTVRTTVRSKRREGDVRAMLAQGGADAHTDRLSFFEADLERDDGWAEAAAGCEYVHHVASPFPAGLPKHEDELIIPAREGALRVLRAARTAGAKRVVLTSSFAAIGYGHAPTGATLDETSWSDATSPTIAAYPKSKTLAERAAWDFVEKEGKGLELAVVNPVGIFGPALAKDTSTSILLVQRLMSGAMPGLPKLWFGVVDVRDVADLHLRAMRDPAAKGERFLAVSGDFMTVKEIAMALKARLGERARKVPTRELPSFLIRLAAMRDPALRAITPELGKKKNATGDKARRLLGWSPRAREEAVVATAESLERLGMLG
jgi:nucleoside-diphosphate-sugar epimerase